MSSNTRFILSELSSFRSNGKSLHSTDQVISVFLSTCIKHLLIHLVEVDLLGSENTSRPSDSDPTYESSRREAQMLHGIEGNQGSSSSQTGFAMDGDGSFFLFSDIEEFIYNILRRNGSIGVVEIDVVDSCFLENLLIVLGFVQSNY